MTFKDNFRSLVNGELEYAKDFLIALYNQNGGETVEQLTTAARILREYSIKVELNQPDLLDIVGTGGDNSDSFNISTAATFIAAGVGCKIAKHFNKGFTSKVGSADFLGALGIKYDLTPEQNQELFEETNICLMYAPSYHPAMKNVAEIRRQISLENKHRTIFNLIGPLANPANAQTYLMGACSLDVAIKLAETLNYLGVKKALVVHGRDGLDEISIGNKTDIREVKGGQIIKYPFDPDIPGYKGTIADLKVDSAEESAAIFKRIISTEDLSYKEKIIRLAVIINAGAAICANGKARDISDGIDGAWESIDRGLAKCTLEHVVEVTNSL